MAALEGDVDIDTLITKNLLICKDKILIKESLHILNNEEKIFLNNMLLKIIKECQSTKINENIIESKINTDDNKIHEALNELLKDLPIVCDHNKEYNYVNEIHDQIKHKTLDITNMKVTNSILINGEKNLHLLPLFASFVRGSFYKFLKSKGVKDNEIIFQCNISRRQLYNYLSFNNIIMKYKSLLRISLPFTTIVKNLTTIIKFIESNDKFRDFFKNSRPF
ncbi:UNVERIFIED_CONTAM: hypothetical protein RMT77_004221 [Armadillidium vulgare]